MKKLTSVLLVLIMVLAMSVSAFAVNPIKNLSDSESQPVKIIVNDAKEVDVYYVKINWDNPTFTYNSQAALQGAWNPEEHTYENGTQEAGWDKTEANVTVENHSNVAIKYTATLTEGADTYGLEPQLVGDYFEIPLDDAVGTPKENPPTGTFTIKINGDAPDKEVTNAIIANVVVTISK